MDKLASELEALVKRASETLGVGLGAVTISRRYDPDSSDFFWSVLATIRLPGKRERFHDCDGYGDAFEDALADCQKSILRRGK